MKLGEKILKLRKKQGLSQEQLGEMIDVTRQTISNWELGETNPNPEQLKKLSQVLNVSIDELLDNDLKEMVFDKVTNTEKNTNIILTIFKIMGIGFITAIILIAVYITLFIVVKNSRETGRKLEKSIHCTIFGEEYTYGVTYYELTGEPIELGGSAYIDNVLNLSQYDDAHQIIDVIHDYARRNGGVCTIIDGSSLNELIDISIKKNSLTAKNVTIVLKNNSKYHITFGEGFIIEKFNIEKNDYEVLKNQTGKNCAFNDIGYVLEPDTEKELKQDWSCDYNELAKGSYRLSKDVYFESDTPVTEKDKYTIAIEFEIE